MNKRDTIQMKIVYDTVKEMNNHPTVDEVFQNIRERYDTIAKATVYRNLQKLTELGDIRVVELAGDSMRFDAENPVHYHFRCRECGLIMNVDAPELPKKIDELARQASGLNIERHRLSFAGLCPMCSMGKNSAY